MVARVAEELGERGEIKHRFRFALQWRVLPDEDGHRYTLQVQQHRRFSGGLQKGLPQSHRCTVLQEGTYLSVHKGPTLSSNASKYDVSYS